MRAANFALFVARPNLERPAAEWAATEAAKRFSPELIPEMLAPLSVGFSDLKVSALAARDQGLCVRNLLRLARDVAHEARTSPRAWLIKITTFDS